MASLQECYVLPRIWSLINYKHVYRQVRISTKQAVKVQENKETVCGVSIIARWLTQKLTKTNLQAFVFVHQEKTASAFSLLCHFNIAERNALHIFQQHFGHCEILKNITTMYKAWLEVSQDCCAGAVGFLCDLQRALLLL